MLDDGAVNQRKPRIFCWIATWKANVARVVAVSNTWAPHCDKVVYVTPPAGLGLPTMDTGVKEGRNGLALYETELENFDFFLKADDDAFVQMDRLRAMLAAHSPDEAAYFGCRLSPYVKDGYMSGGAGYGLSRWVHERRSKEQTFVFREALRRFGERRNETRECGPAQEHEDLQMGRCMHALNVSSLDTRDEQGRHRMLPTSVQNFFGNPAVWQPFMFYAYPGDRTEKMEHLISVHYVSPKEIFRLYSEHY
ncbi:N-acetylgalactosaminide beta-1,3-galactosyltransferase [Aphelenchoides fujianensis]|nr:N-acetylgalactosaminide beta-1,3-galactosyltransferase [Aphelenchoides fujianensis]